jgi:hypothetical protein
MVLTNGVRVLLHPLYWRILLLNLVPYLALLIVG